MRRVQVATSARLVFQTMLEQGAVRFGLAIAMEKERIVYDVLTTYLSEHPYRGKYDRRLKLYTYHVSKTPFVLAYEFDDAELRVLFIVHERADRRLIDPKAVDW